MLLTYRFRAKDATSGKHLVRMTFGVNQIWNYCGGIQNDSRRLNRRWPSAFDLMKLVAGSSKGLGLHSDVVQDVVKHWTRSRDKARHKPAWRVSRGAKRSLGWVPFMCARPLKVAGDAVRFLGHTFRLWLSRPIPDDIRSGSFSQDATGRWYLNVVCKVDADLPAGGEGEIGIDLGLGTYAALSNGEKIHNPRHLKKSAATLARAQRAGRKALARKIHRKIAAQRRHFLHETTTTLVRRFAFISCGDVNSVSLARTRMAKSVLDAAWGACRTMLSYKTAMRRGARYVQPSERKSTQTCSECLALSGPRGLKGLRVRSWVCDGCRTLHNRDTNSAVNILYQATSGIHPPATLRTQPPLLL